jgi:hypothetical protein
VYPQQAAVEIQMMCEAATYADLPPVYKILANLKKKESVIAILSQLAFSQLLEERAREADSTRVAPVVTPEMLERIFAFKAGRPRCRRPYSCILLVPPHNGVNQGHYYPSS